MFCWGTEIRVGIAVPSSDPCAGSRSDPSPIRRSDPSAIGTERAAAHSVLRAIRAPDLVYGRDPMTKRKRPPQAPPAAAARKKNTRGTTEQTSGAGPSRPKKGGRRGEPKEPVDLNAIEGEYLVDFEKIPDPNRHIRWGHVTRDQRRAAMRFVRRFELTSRGLLDALTLPVHRPHVIPANLNNKPKVIGDDRQRTVFFCHLL
ncbi:hypothetical protein R1sor_000072 [Riccia sorocarpa]|uniref:Uncharacterized protein n=1 Tax=Riccia sorocarpa TaxID=122646 RepID=A0ABD3GS22_9MARC